MKKQTGNIQYLKEIRKKQKLTQVELDQAVQFPRGTIAQMESGVKLFTTSRILALAEYFGVEESAFRLPEWAGAERRQASALRKIVEALALQSESRQYIILGKVLEMLDDDTLLKKGEGHA